LESVLIERELDQKNPFSAGILEDVVTQGANFHCLLKPDATDWEYVDSSKNLEDLYLCMIASGWKDYSLRCLNTPAKYF
jgi:hypothetical protein